MSHFLSWCTFFVINSAWQFVVLVAVTALVVRASPKMPNRLQYLLWVSCLVLAVTLPLLSTYLALVPVHSSTAAARADDVNRWRVPKPPQRGRLTLHLTEVPAMHSHLNVFGVIAGLYSACLVFGVGRVLVRLGRTGRIVARRIPLTLEASDLAVLQNSLKANRCSVEVFASLELEGPARELHRRLPSRICPYRHP